MVIKKIVTISLFLILSTKIFSRELISDSILAEVREVSLQILKDCPAPDCLILGIGQSPTPFTAYLQATGAENLQSLPLSSFRYNLFDQSALSPAEEKILFKHFDRFLGKKFQEAKKIVLVDYAISGRSTFGSKGYLDKYLKMKGHSKPITPFLISSNSHLLKNKLPNLAKIYKIDKTYQFQLDSRSELLKKLLGQGFDNYSPHGQFNILGFNEPKTLQHRNYLELVNEIKQKIKISKRSPVSRCLKNLVQNFSVN